MKTKMIRSAPGRPAQAGRRHGQHHLRAWATACLAVTVGLSLAGCGTAADGGYDLNPPGADSSGGSFGGDHLGEPAGFPVYLPVAKVPVTLVSARLLKLPGFPAPRLVHLGVWDATGGIFDLVRGLPPPHCTIAVPCNGPGSPFAGFRLKPRDSNEIVYFWVKPPRRPGDYYVAGLRVTYRVGSGTYTGNLYAGGLLCARAGPLDPNCSFSDKASNRLSRLASHNE